MFIDAREVEFGAVIKSDVCIVGGGIAGLTLARELDRRGIDTCLLESGGLSPDRAIRDLSRGENVGVPYEVAEGSRSRYLGGGTNAWDGRCQPLDDQDFRIRDWVPNSGWPIGPDDLKPHYDQAQTALGLGPNSYDLRSWVDRLARADVRRLPLPAGRVTDSLSQFSSPESFGSLYHRALDRAAHLRVFLYATVVEIETDPAAVAARRAIVFSLKGRKMTVTARIFVLAAGAIENARILLASNKTRRAGLGNSYDLVGRYFMDHPSVLAGEVRFVDGWKNNRLYDERFNRCDPDVAVEGVSFAGYCHLASDLQREERLLNSSIWFSSVYVGEHPAVTNALEGLRRRVVDGEGPRERLTDLLTRLASHPKEALQTLLARWLGVRQKVSRVHLRALVEPVPDAESRVTLSEEQDELGTARVRVRWRLDALAQRTLDRTCAIFAEELERAGVAKVTLGPKLEGKDWQSQIDFASNQHQMGTTRMHDSPRAGVVDRYGLVHGMRNLYVAGGSVFPTAGAGPPSLTVVALALRMADRLIDELKPGGRLR
ncbi:MAG: GMC family oxidoreductase [Nitrospiraceae bacterium]|nr:GMC family oxidoreductase [Nitrospiraceae bacterium]